jgi:hypothetical protein
VGSIPYRHLAVGLLLAKHEHAAFVRHDHVWSAVLVDVARRHLGADAAVGVDLLRLEGGSALAVTRELEPVEHRRRVRLRIALDAVGPTPLAGEDVEQAVAVDIDEPQRMHLTEGHAVRMIGRRRPHDAVLGEAAVGLLLEPAQTVPMAVVAGDHVVAAVTVDVVDIHLPAASGSRRTERARMEGPERAGRIGGGMFEPAFLHDEVDPAIAVDVSHA